MAVRVRLVFRGASGKRLESAGVLNGAFETDDPCVLLPARAAGQILSTPLAEARHITAEVAGGEASFLSVEETLEMCVFTGDRQGPAVRCMER